MPYVGARPLPPPPTAYRPPVKIAVLSRPAPPPDATRPLTFSSARGSGGFRAPTNYATPQILRRVAINRPMLQGFDAYQLEGLSLKGIVKGIGKAATSVGHAVGKVVTSKVGQAIEGGALALTGVGLPAAVGIMAATKATGNLIKPGGNLKSAATGAAQGAIEGAAAGLAGKAIQAVAPSVTAKAQSIANKVLPGTPFKTLASPTAAIAAGAGKSAVVDSIASTGLTALEASRPQLTPSGTIVTPSDIGVGSLLPAAIIPAAAIAATALPALPAAVTASALPASSTYRRTASRQGSSGIGTARAVMQAGEQANQTAQQTADKIDQLSQKLDSVQQAAAAASIAGNALGSSQLTDLASSLSQQIVGLQGLGSVAAGDVRAAGGAIQGAATGAVGGAFWDSIPKPVLYGGAAVLGLGVIALLSRGGGGSARRAAA